jgi:hypothetical protein
LILIAGIFLNTLLGPIIIGLLLSNIRIWTDVVKMGNMVFVDDKSGKGTGWPIIRGKW